MSKQVTTSDAWWREIRDLHRAAAASSSRHSLRDAHEDAWDAFWERSHIWVGGEDAELAALTNRYAQNRYLQAIQAGTWVPIKFNGEVFTAQLPPVCSRPCTRPSD